MSFLVDENEFGDAPDGNENNPCESKIPILISNIGDKNNPNKCLFKRKIDANNNDMCAILPKVVSKNKNKVSPLRKLNKPQKIKQQSNTTKNIDSDHLNKNVLMKSIFAEIMKKKKVWDSVLKRDKSESTNSNTNKDISQVSFVMQPTSGMKSITKLWSNFKNSPMSRELTQMSKHNLDKVNNVYSKIPSNNISAFGMDYLKREKEEFINVRECLIYKCNKNYSNQTQMNILQNGYIIFKN